MKKVMHRIPVVLLAAALVLSLCSCGGKAATAEKRKLLMWSFAANNVAEWNQRKADIEAKFNVELEIQTIPENAFVQKLQAVMMDGKNVPDIIEWKIEANQILNANEKKSFVLPLNAYTKDSAVFGKVVPGRVNWVTYGKNVYGLPHDVHPVVLVYNDTLWKAVGVDVAAIKTWDEFFEASKKLTAEKKDGKPVHYALPYGNDGLNNTMIMIWQQSGSQVLNADGTPCFDSPEFTAFLNKWMGWMGTGAFTTWDWGNFGALVKNGTLASYTSPDWWVEQVNDAVAAGQYQFKVRALPEYSPGSPVTASWGGSFLAIPKGTKDPSFVYDVMEYMQYDLGAVKTRYSTTGMLPPIESVWDDEVFKQGDPRFGGQKLGELQVAMARAMPSVNSGDIFWDALADFTGMYSEIATGKMTVEEGLAATQKKAEARIK